MHKWAQARLYWAHGNFTEAISQASGALKERFCDEAEVIRTGLIRQPQAKRYTPKSDSLFILTNSLPTTNSGYSYRTQALLRACRAAGMKVAGLTRLGYPMSVGRFSSDGYDQVDGVTYFRSIPWKVPALLSDRIALQAQEIVNIALELRPAVLHATTDYQNGLATRVAAQALGIPWVYEMRGELEKSWVARFPKADQEKALASERYRSLRALEKELADSADAVVVLSKVQRDSLIARGVAAEKIWIVPNGVSARLLDTTRDRSKSRKILGLKTNEFLFGSVTSVVDYEGLDTLVKVLPLLLEKGIPARLAIVGDGISLPALKEQANSLGVSDKCIFPGRVSQNDADLWYQALDVFCVPRKDTEVTRTVTPMKSIPALAYGVPVLVSHLPALEELVPEVFSHWLIQANDEISWSVALCKLINTNGPTTSEQCKEFVYQRTWEKNANLYSQLYSSLRRSYDQQ
ncbi:hypothetical protein BSR29_00550 [Boudabousia liubingyangii]|uniref:Glycosyltransferase n=2 Tax=Boudabousia liubingyangii TaxID=1921764 RepID=A0A1Q5PPP0_9ACTO|nr:hypothetical protein BSR29_00550 [Boudabousia liubingyangii]